MQSRKYVKPRGAFSFSHDRFAISPFLRHGGFPPKTSSQTAHNARFLEGQPRERNPYKKIMPL